MPNVLEKELWGRWMLRMPWFLLQSSFDSAARDVATKKGLLFQAMGDFLKAFPVLARRGKEKES